ncbi:MAG: very short patch repair endonuclease [Bacteroidota bacterium]
MNSEHLIKEITKGNLRSKIMRAIKSRGNLSTEIKVISYFKRYKICGWRRNYKLFGNPDFVFPRLKIVLFIDGCFWHGHNCRNLIPKTNIQYWNNKIERTKTRDNLVSNKLTEQGWKVIRFWECELKQESTFIPKLKTSMLLT